MKYAVEYLPQFKEDMTEIAEYIGVKLENPAAAENLIKEISDKTASLADMPYMYSLYNSQYPLKFEFRKIIVGSYAVFYYVDEAKKLITVARVIYARRNIDSFLK